MLKDCSICRYIIHFQGPMLLSVSCSSSSDTVSLTGTCSKAAGTGHKLHCGSPGFSRCPALAGPTAALTNNVDENWRIGGMHTDEQDN